MSRPATPQPAMSVVVPLYQSEATVEATLASLAAQDCRNIEIVVVDDGSTDGGPALVAAAARRDPRIRMVAQLNRGLAGARNAGIRAARSDVIGFCDADDVWAPGKAEAHLALLAASPEAGLTFSGSWIMARDGSPTGIRREAPEHPVGPDEMLLRNPVGNGSSAVARRACLDAVAFEGPDGARQWFDESYRQCEDIQMWMRVVLSGWEVRGLRAPLVGYRVGGQTLSSNLDRQADAWERMLASVRAADPALAARAGGRARATMLGWLARKSVLALDGRQALRHLWRALRGHPRMLAEDPARTAFALACACVLSVVPRRAAAGLSAAGIAAFSRIRVPASGRPPAAPAVAGIPVPSDA